MTGVRAAPVAGRLIETVSARTARLVYGDGTDTVASLTLSTQIDLAHIVMLTDCGLLDRRRAGLLVGEISRLRTQAFAPVTARPARRGSFLAYEAHLIEVLGIDVGGALHSARSRNDLKATATAIRLRATLIELADELARLVAALLSRGRRFAEVVMPIYTHHQAAVPATYGWYLTGVATALLRDLLAVQQAIDGLRDSPLGACGAAGTELPVDPSRTAALLGFEAPAMHALDSVASRDSVLRGLGAAAGAAITVSRLACDLQLWSTAEFGLISFPDRLVGGSSAMPQKRNAFLLEHLRAKAGTAIGAWAAFASNERAVPFTNSIEIGTDAVEAAWPAFEAVLTGVRLAQTIVTGAIPVPDRMRERAEQGFVTATSLANLLMAQGIPFREAHSRVGAAVRGAISSGTTSIVTGLVGGTPSLDATVSSMSQGGGPGAAATSWARARHDLVGLVARRHAVERRVRAAEAELAAAIDTLAAT